MVRDGNRISFTDEEKEKLKVKKYTEPELRDNIKRFERKENKRRYIFCVILMIFVIFAIVLRELKYLFFLGAFFMVFLIAFYEYIARINGKAVKRKFYIEFMVCEKLEVENIIEQNLKLGSLLSFYPVKGKDLSTGYVSKFYLDTREQYVTVKKGDTVRLSVKGEKL